MEPLFRQAADWVRQSEAILIGAGAGMGVDSGLPDFRGNQGFWKAYPAFRQLGLSFVELANPRWFFEDPPRAWGFYGHRLQLYRKTAPHEGFSKLLQWCMQKPEFFVFTSNVDGHFQAAGFPADKVVECHGSISHLQCSIPCNPSIWPGDHEWVIDPQSMRANNELPHCQHCHQMARPNILMFGDGHWIGDRTEAQFDRYRNFLNRVQGAQMAVLEFGAGTAVPTVRFECERQRPHLIRINPRDSETPDPQSLSIPCGALEAIRGIERALKLI